MNVDVLDITLILLVLINGYKVGKLERQFKKINDEELD